MNIVDSFHTAVADVMRYKENKCYKTGHSWTRIRDHLRNHFPRAQFRKVPRAISRHPAPPSCLIVPSRPSVAHPRLMLLFQRI